MYSPHQVPWRIEGTIDLLKKVTEKGKRSFYFTEDVGHHHIKYVRPSAKSIIAAFKLYKKYGEVYGIWLGTDKAFDIFYNAESINGDIDKNSLEQIKQEFSDSPHMFSIKEDGDCYEWIRKLGCYSPIIHLQQTDGLSSSHKHFTIDNNQNGIINGEKLLSSLKESYDSSLEVGMPQRCDKIYLTLEAFTSTASINYDTLKDYKKSVEYWRNYIPEDGESLEMLVKSL